MKVFTIIKNSLKCKQLFIRLKKEAKEREREITLDLKIIIRMHNVNVTISICLKQFDCHGNSNQTFKTSCFFYGIKHFCNEFLSIVGFILDHNLNVTDK